MTQRLTAVIVGTPGSSCRGTTWSTGAQRLTAVIVGTPEAVIVTAAMSGVLNA